MKTLFLGFWKNQGKKNTLHKLALGKKGLVLGERHICECFNPGKMPGNHYWGFWEDKCDDKWPNYIFFIFTFRQWTMILLKLSASKPIDKSPWRLVALHPAQIVPSHKFPIAWTLPCEALAEECVRLASPMKHIAHQALTRRGRPPLQGVQLSAVNDLFARSA